MLKLIKTEDKEVLNNSNFAKNAVFYKDMLCFVEAYTKITEQKDSLPDYCFLQDGSFCLEGICLLMKMYATEFEFETIKLTLDYLKILYFATASFADDDGFVDREKIIAEFDEYRKASIEYCDGQKNEFNEKKKKVEAKEKQTIQNELKTLLLKKWSKINFILSIVIFALSVASICLPIIVVNYKSVSSLEFALSLAGVIVGFLLAIIFKTSSKKMSNLSQDVAFHNQSLRKNLDNEKSELNELQTKYYRVFSEKYEYAMCFPHLLSKYGKVLSIDEILQRAGEYKLLSYNIVYDINRLFRSQQKEIDLLVSDIENIVLNEDCQKDFADIYEQIKSQDWLYYNSEIRYHFLKKFADFSEREHIWKLEFNGQKINPFDVNIKELSREVISFAQSKGDKLITLSLSDFIKTKYFKNLGDLNFSNGYSVDAFKRVKSNYLLHFYNSEVVSGQSELIYDSKNKRLANEKALENCESIPTLVNLKLKLIEASTGLGNSDAKVIKAISQSIFKEDKNDNGENLALSENDIDYPKFTAEEIEETEESITYTVGKTKKVGYKINW